MPGRYLFSYLYKAKSVLSLAKCLDTNDELANIPYNDSGGFVNDLLYKQLVLFIKIIWSYRGYL